MSSKKLRGIYYDTETTGISSKQDRIIEIAAFDVSTGATFNELINPQMPIPQGATAIHHIDNEMVKDAPTFEVIGKRFAEFCSGDDVVLIAHNNDQFDCLFLEEEFGRSGLEFPKWKYIDTLKWARRYRPDLPKHNLQFLRELFGISANQAHRALDDVMVLYEMFSFMIDDLPYEEVFNLMQVKKAMSRMPFGKHQGKLLKDVPKNYVSWLADQGALDKPENLQLKESFQGLGLVNA
jgi:DNA polymerase III subunit epsilon